MYILSLVEKYISSVERRPFWCVPHTCYISTAVWKYVQHQIYICRIKSIHVYTRLNPTDTDCVLVHVHVHVLTTLPQLLRNFKGFLMSMYNTHVHKQYVHVSIVYVYTVYIRTYMYYMYVRRTACYSTFNVQCIYRHVTVHLMYIHTCTYIYMYM